MARLPRAPTNMLHQHHVRPAQSRHPDPRTPRQKLAPPPRRVCAPTTDLLTAASTIDTPGVGITAAAGTELALQSPSRTHLQCALRPTSRNRLLPKEWAISAPAAVLGRGSHLSGSLSGIRPQSPVTRRRLGSPLHYQPADRAAPQSPLLATVSRGYRPQRADRRSITEPFAVPIFTGMHGLVSETSIYVRQNQPGAPISGPAAPTASPRCPEAVFILRRQSPTTSAVRPFRSL